MHSSWIPLILSDLREDNSKHGASKINVGSAKTILFTHANVNGQRRQNSGPPAAAGQLCPKAKQPVAGCRAQPPARRAGTWATPPATRCVIAEEILQKKRWLSPLKNIQELSYNINIKQNHPKDVLFEPKL